MIPQLEELNRSDRSAESFRPTNCNPNRGRTDSIFLLFFLHVFPLKPQRGQPFYCRRRGLRYTGYTVFWLNWFLVDVRLLSPKVVGIPSFFVAKYAFWGVNL